MQGIETPQPVVVEPSPLAISTSPLSPTQKDTTSTGSCIAYVTLRNGHDQIYWVGRDGAIQARRYLSDSSSFPQQQAQREHKVIPDFPFTVAGAASTRSGGSIAALATISTSESGVNVSTVRVHLWWIDNSGRLVNAI
ncbi:MAG: hypothetical protein M1837_005642 [Sclerophora amabilis]|nr:MAG: hypothetical protein M1837_005642 [Sclerophora amabilis]